MTPRLYISQPLGAGHILHMEESQLHYIRNVLRLQGGDLVHLFNGQDGEWQAQLEIHGKKDARLHCQNCLRPQTTDKPLLLMCALIKPARLEFLIEKATELGITHIMPLVTDHTTIRKMNVDRLKAHATEAAEQCERLTVPEISPIINLHEAILGHKGHILWADESREQSAKLIETLDQHPIDALLIGPEGGFSENEKQFLNTRPNVHPTHMGTLILRAETAALALISAYQCYTGAWR